MTGLPSPPSDALDTITCLHCGRRFRALGSHLRRAHQTSAEEYRLAYDLPASAALVCEELREQKRELMRSLRAAEIITNDHLPAAVEAARQAGRGRKNSVERERQQQIARAVDASEPDSGRITRLLGTDSTPYDVEVSWDSGVRTPAVSAELEVV